MEYDKKYLPNSNISRLSADIGNDVYAASFLFERLEKAGRLRGSGHCLRQELAAYAQELLEKNFIA